MACPRERPAHRARNAVPPVSGLPERSFLLRKSIMELRRPATVLAGQVGRQAEREARNPPFCLFFQTFARPQTLAEQRVNSHISPIMNTLVTSLLKPAPNAPAEERVEGAWRVYPFDGALELDYIDQAGNPSRSEE